MHPGIETSLHVWTVLWEDGVRLERAIVKSGGLPRQPVCDQGLHPASHGDAFACCVLLSCQDLVQALTTVRVRPFGQFELAQAIGAGFVEEGVETLKVNSCNRQRGVGHRVVSER
jgi:hypothetical protein